MVRRDFFQEESLLLSGKPHSKWVNEDGWNWVLHRQACLPVHKPLGRPNVLTPALWPADVGEWNACIIVHDLQLLCISVDPTQSRTSAPS